MTVLSFTQDDGLYTNGVVSQSNPFSVASNALKADSIAGTNDARILFQSAADGTFTAELSAVSSSLTANVGLIFRAVDLDNNWQAFCNFQQNRVRLVKLVGGVGDPVFNEVLGGYGLSESRSLTAECSGDQIILKQDNDVLYTHTDSTFEDATLTGFRSGHVDYRLDSLTFPDAEGAVGKTVTFALGEDIQGVTDARFIISPVPLGPSITDGDLDASESEVTISLDAFPAIDAGTKLMLIATNKQTAEDATDVIAWDVSAVVEV